MTARDGWTPGIYQIAMGKPVPDGGWERTGTETEAGETRGAFGIARDVNGRVWKVTHLPSGMAVADFERKGDAKRFCLQVANLIDWTAVTGTDRQTDSVRAAVRTAMDRCRAVSLVRVL